jgi:hypothetical protein
VTDVQAHVVRKLDLHDDAHAVTTLVGKPTATPRLFDGPAAEVELTNPGGVAFDATGALVLADGAWVRRLGPDGVLRVVAGGATGEQDGYWMDASFDGAVSIAALPDGDLVVGEANGRRLRRLRLDAAGRAAVVWTAAGPNGADRPDAVTNGAGAAARFSAIYACVADARGTVYVAEPNAQQVRQVAFR